MDPAKKSTLQKRLLFGGLTIGLIVTIAYLDANVIGPWPSLIVLSLLSLLAQWEIGAMLKKAGALTGLRPIGFWFGVLALAAFVVVGAMNPAQVKTTPRTLEFTALVFLMTFHALRHYPWDPRTSPWFVTCFSAFFLPTTLPSAMFIRLHPEMGALVGLLFVVAIAKIGDIAAYFVGSFAGKRKLAPQISPNKTWEGAIASVFAAVGLAAFLQSQGWAAGLRIEQALVAGLVINVAAQISDLSKSVLKRACGVKDSGSYFSVMGGALDMIDSLIFSAPAYVALRLFWA